MANQREIKVGSRDFVVRVGGEDVPVEVVAKVGGADGGRLEWQLRNLKTGRTLTRSSAGIRRAGDPVRQMPAGFGRPAVSANPPPPPRSRGRPVSAPTHQIPQAQFGSQTFGSQAFGSKTFGSQQGSSFGSHRRAESPAPKSEAGLGSLRGKIKLPSSRPAPVAEVEKPVRQRRSPEYPSDLAKDLCEALKRTSGTEWEVRSVFAQVLAEYNSKRFFPGMPTGV